MKIEQKIVTCFAMSAEKIIQPYLDKGWHTVSVTATSGTAPSPTPGFSSMYRGPDGQVIFILQKD